jgi:hypothetical protein
MRRLLALLGLEPWRSDPARVEPRWDDPKVVSLKAERLKRLPVMFVGYMSDRDVREADRRRAEEEARVPRLVHSSAMKQGG